MSTLNWNVGLDCKKGATLKTILWVGFSQEEML